MSKHRKVTSLEKWHIRVVGILVMLAMVAGTVPVIIK